MALENKLFISEKKKYIIINRTQQLKNIHIPYLVPSIHKTLFSCQTYFYQSIKNVQFKKKHQEEKLQKRPDIKNGPFMGLLPKRSRSGRTNRLQRTATMFNILRNLRILPTFQCRMLSSHDMYAGPRPVWKNGFQRIQRTMGRFERLETHFCPVRSRPVGYAFSLRNIG